MVDFAVKLPGVDPKRVALMGVSLGGLLAPRAAAFEKRIAAVIANDGLYDYAAAQVAGRRRKSANASRRCSPLDTAPELDHALDQAVKTRPTARWALAHGMYAMGAPTPRAYLAASLAYNLRNGVAEPIKCPTLVCEAEGDLFFQGQPQELYDHLTCRETRMGLTNERARRPLPGRRRPFGLRAHLRQARGNAGLMAGVEDCRGKLRKKNRRHRDRGVGGGRDARSNPQSRERPSRRFCPRVGNNLAAAGLARNRPYSPVRDLWRRSARRPGATVQETSGEREVSTLSGRRREGSNVASRR